MQISLHPMDGKLICLNKKVYFIVYVDDMYKLI